MSLSDTEKQIVKNLWVKIAPSAAEIGSEALSRMFLLFPQTKIYFSHWPDLSPGSDSVKEHGKKIMHSIGTAVNNIDDLNYTLSNLNERHVSKLRIEPSNFKILSNIIIVVIANHFPTEFIPEIHHSLEKFLTSVSRVLSTKSS